MSGPRRQTRSTGAQRSGQQSDAQFWSNRPDPLLIERGQTEAIQLVRNTVNTAMIGQANAPMGEATGANVTDASTVPLMVYVDDEGLEEQFLIGDEASQEIMDITANRVTTPVDNNDAAPLDLIYTQRSQQDEELDLHPSRGPREESLVNVMEQFLDNNYEDVLRTSNIQTNFSIAASNRSIAGKPNLPLSWIVPDGTNQTLEEIHDKKVASGSSLGGGQAGAIVVNL